MNLAEINFKDNQMNVHRTNRSRTSIHNDMNTRLHSRDMIDINLINNSKIKYKGNNRFEIERDEFMKNSNKIDEDDNDNDNFMNNRINNNFDREMHMRPEFEINKLNNNFKNQRTKKNISSFEPNNNFADINSDTKLSDNVNEININVNNINNFGLFLYDNLLQIMNTNFIFSPYLIYTIFGSIFIGSDGNTEVELKNYFNFPRVDILSAGLTEINKKYLNQNILKSELFMGNCIIFSDEIDYNTEFCNNINVFTKIRKINKLNSLKETEDINNIVMTILGNNKKSINQQNLENNCITLLNYAKINPRWMSYFSKITKNNGIEFMHAFNQSFGYFEQPKLQVLELESTGNICFGIIYGDIELNDKNYKFIISNLKRTYLREVCIPKFTIQTKLRYTNILKETDLKTIFLDLNVPNLFTSQCEITDCIQNIEFNLSENSEKNTSIKNVGIMTSKTFIISQAFRFYIRLKSNNCILFLGSY